MEHKITKSLTLILTEHDAQTLDMILCDYENEGEQHSADEYQKRLNPFADDLRIIIQDIVL